MPTMPVGQERWLAVLGHEGRYEVSSTGRVRSCDRVIEDTMGRSYPRPGGMLRPHELKSGHLVVTIDQTLGRQVRKLVHVLVLEAFVGPAPAGMEACHSNDIPSDNRVCNLRWGTRRENSLDRVRNGIHPMAAKTHCKRGHEFTAENTRIEIRSNTRVRRCLSCERERSQRRVAAARLEMSHA